MYGIIGKAGILDWGASLKDNVKAKLICKICTNLINKMNKKLNKTFVVIQNIMLM